MYVSARVLVRARYLDMKEDSIMSWLLHEACDDRLHSMLCRDALQTLVDLREMGRQKDL